MTDIDTITAELEQLSIDLRIITAAIPILGKVAETKAKDIGHAIRDAETRLATAHADKLEQERRERIAGFSDITVALDYPPQCEGNLLRANFIIDYVKLFYDPSSRMPVAKPHRVTSFRELPDDAYDYLVTVHPDRIPAEIMALCPGDPNGAFAAYFQGLRRGMFRSASRVDPWADLTLAA
ncbi:hypothetical protein [Sphingobium phenoxybenzoativorans]|uniref:hypothetical protein n=1 Tax=Sphingobium phenoxybenzoativorans TaxID=1592790 RepID=UPI0008724FA9|nr:hypothetical protein [Sphingobium phenoxybenzoativorans]